MAPVRRVVAEGLVAEDFKADVGDLRPDIRTEFATVRGEMREGFAAIGGEMHEGFAAIWLGQVFAIVGFLALLLRTVGH